MTPEGRQVGEHAFEVCAGVYELQLPLPFPIAFVNVFVIDAGEGLTLVDAGLDTPASRDALVEGLKAIGHRLEDVRQVLITHLHPDHYGQAHFIRSVAGARLAMHQAEVALLPSRYLDMTGLFGQTTQWMRYNGVPQEDVDQIVRASIGVADFVHVAQLDLVLQGDEELFLGPGGPSGISAIRAVHTPGHSVGHLCYYDPVHRLLFSGDHLLEKISPNVGFHPQSVDNPLGDYLDSLDRVAALDVDRVLPGHGRIFSGVAARVEELKKHHRTRLARFLEALSGGPRTGYDLVLAFWGETLGAHNRRLALAETVAHLEFLERRGFVRHELRDGVAYWVGQQAAA